MDRALVGEKIESLRRCVHRVEQKCPHDVASLATDMDLQDIVALNLTRAVQLCVDTAAHILAETEEPVPQTMGAAFDSLGRIGAIDADLATRMKKAVGFRNIAVHNYQAIGQPRSEPSPSRERAGVRGSEIFQPRNKEGMYTTVCTCIPGVTHANRERP